jgi:predicted DNA-binding protein with PD1-like motif
MKVVPLRLQPGDDLRLALAQLRLAGATQATAIHLHIAIADSSGAVIGLLPEWRFRRELDPVTGHAELRISPQDLG